MQAYLLRDNGIMKLPILLNITFCSCRRSCSNVKPIKTCLSYFAFVRTFYDLESALCALYADIHVYQAYTTSQHDFIRNKFHLISQCCQEVHLHWTGRPILCAVINFMVYSSHQFGPTTITKGHQQVIGYRKLPPAYLKEQS